jgi:uncharacterized protein YbjT (DUF2867 family)
MKKMKVLVTGGTGYLGSAITRALARAGHEPIAFSRHATTSVAAAGLPGRAIDVTRRRWSRSGGAIRRSSTR